MTRELKNMDVQYVSYVDKAANQKKFFLTKSEKQPNFEKQVRIVKDANDPKQLVYGVVYEPDVEDAHGDFATADAIEKSAHAFLTKYRQIDAQHNFVDGAGEVVESYVAPSDLSVGEETITKGSWVLVTKATDEIWEAIQKNEYTGYSLAGTAEVIEKQASPASSVNDETGLFNVLKNFFMGKTAVQKGAVRDSYERSIKARNFWAAMDSFESTIRSYNWQTDNYEFATDETTIREALQDFTDIVNEILLTSNVVKAIGKPPTDIQKAGKKISAARMDKINEALTTLQELKDEVDGEEDVVKAEVTDPTFAKGDRVSVKGTPHMEGQKDGEISIVKTTNVYGIKFDGMDGTHKWYIESELKSAPASNKGSTTMKTKSEGGNEMTPEQLQEAVQKALEPMNTRLEALEKGIEPKEDDVSKQLETAVAKALEPLNTRLDAIEKARGISQQQQEPTPVQKANEPSYMGLLR